MTEAAAPAHCTAQGCPATEVTQCAYVDRRSRPCSTAWCHEHAVMIDGAVYCRRHAGVVRAVGTQPDRLQSLPDLENRAPSLVNWMARDVDSDVRNILLRYAQGETTIDESPIMATGPPSNRMWTRHWKVLSHTGFNMRISLTVTEAEDTKVRASVDGTLVTEAEPPWIARRQAGVPLSPDIDAAERARFHRELLEAVEAHLARYIPGSSTPGG